MIDLIANIFSVSGRHGGKLFKDLYKLFSRLSRSEIISLSEVITKGLLRDSLIFWEQPKTIIIVRKKIK